MKIFIALVLFAGCADVPPLSDPCDPVMQPVKSDINAIDTATLGAILDNTEYSAEPSPPPPGMARGIAYVGRCTMSGWKNRISIALPSCVQPMAFPVRAVVTGGVWVHDRPVLGARQIGKLNVDDIVVVRDLHVIQELPYGNFFLSAEVDYPKAREFRFAAGSP